jgi:two-component system, LytTR family, sensor histidine kinase AlgZ
MIRVHGDTLKNTEQIDRRKSDRTTYRNLPVALYAPPPDWRNVGIVLRSVLLVLMGLILVVLAAFPPAQWLVQTSLALSQAILPMIVVLLFAILLSPWLANLERWQWISLLVVVAGLAAGSLVTASTVWQRLQHCLLAVIAMGVVLMYLDLRGKAFSPALTEARLQALQARIRPHFLFNSLNSVLKFGSLSNIWHSNSNVWALV